MLSQLIYAAFQALRDVATLALFVVPMIFIARRFWWRDSSNWKMFRVFWRVAMSVCLVGTLISFLLVVFNLPAYIPRNSIEWACDTLILWGLPALFGWPGDTSDHNQKLRCIVSWTFGVMAALELLMLCSWFMLKMASEDGHSWTEFYVRNGGLDSPTAAFYGTFIPMAILLAIGAAVSSSYRSKAKMVVTGSLMGALAVGMIVMMNRGSKVGRPSMIFGVVAVTEYYPEDYSLAVGQRDTTDARFFIGPNTNAQDSIALCGDQTSKLTVGNYYRAMAQVYEYEVPWDKSGSMMTFKRCYQLSKLEEWQPSSRHPETVTGIVQNIRPTEDPRRSEVSFRLLDGTSKSVMACADGTALNRLRMVAGKAVQFEYDTGLHSKKVNCDPVFGFKLFVAVAPTDPFMQEVVAHIKDFDDGVVEARSVGPDNHTIEIKGQHIGEAVAGSITNDGELIAKLKARGFTRMLIVDPEMTWRDFELR